MMARNNLTGRGVQMQTYQELVCYVGRRIKIAINLSRSGKCNPLSHFNS